MPQPPAILISASAQRAQWQARDGGVCVQSPRWPLDKSSLPLLWSTGKARTSLTGSALQLVVAWGLGVGLCLHRARALSPREGLMCKVKNVSLGCSEGHRAAGNSPACQEGVGSPFWGLVPQKAGCGHCSVVPPGSWDSPRLMDIPMVWVHGRCNQPQTHGCHQSQIHTHCCCGCQETPALSCPLVCRWVESPVVFCSGGLLSPSSAAWCPWGFLEVCTLEPGSLHEIWLKTPGKGGSWSHREQRTPHHSHAAAAQIKNVFTCVAGRNDFPP